jgi:2-amino-4-hydroxy-6-hydroxymethyldihydropteridine diphosphokinase
MGQVRVTAYIGLGGNLGDARAAVRQAMNDIATLPLTTVTRRSSLYSTAPVDSSGPDYINAVVAVSTDLSAPDLLAHLQQLELSAGRKRPYRNAPRTLDTDILLYGDLHITDVGLEVPHPRMFQRAFVLVPLAEIAPEQVQPAQLQAVRDQVIKRLS